MYGRVRYLVELLADRCGYFLAVGRVPTCAGFNEPRLVLPTGLPIPVREDSPLVDTIREDDEPAIRFAKLMLATERSAGSGC